MYVCVDFIFIISLYFQTPHRDSWDHQGSEGRFPSGHGEAGVSLWREPLQCASPFLHQRENHHHPVPSLTPRLWPLNLFIVDIPATVLMQRHWLHVFHAGHISYSLVFIIHLWTLKKIWNLLALKVNLSFQRLGENNCFRITQWSCY